MQRSLECVYIHRRFKMKQFISGRDFNRLKKLEKVTVLCDKLRIKNNDTTRKF